MKELKFIDLFCGIGGFRIGFENACREYKVKPTDVFSSDIDKHCRISYEENFHTPVYGDITKISEDDVPDHDVLLAGFPCQPFSIIGRMKGFQDTRGTLFFDIARILDAKKPRAFILENVKQLVGHNKGKTFKKIIRTLKSLGYKANYCVLNALDYGLPQKRERIFIVGHKEKANYKFPDPFRPFKPLSEILEEKVDKRYFASKEIQAKRKAMHNSAYDISVWHENKSGNICSYPYSCALRAGASYNYLLVNGERRFTPRELLRLHGFPDSYKIVVSDNQLRRQTGNAVPVNLVFEVARKLIPIIV